MTRLIDEKGVITNVHPNEVNQWLDQGWKKYATPDTNPNAPANLFKLEDGSYGLKIGDVMHGITDKASVENLFGTNIKDIRDEANYGQGGISGGNKTFQELWAMQPGVQMNEMAKTPAEWLAGVQGTGRKAGEITIDTTQQAGFRPRADGENMTDYLNAKKAAGFNVDLGNPADFSVASSGSGSGTPSGKITLYNPVTNQPFQVNASEKNLYTNKGWSETPVTPKETSAPATGIKILNETDLQTKRNELTKAGIPQSEWSKYISSPDTKGNLYWTQPATLTSPTGVSKAVATGSEEASKLLSSGWTLGAQPKTGAITPKKMQTENPININGIGGEGTTGAGTQGSAEASSRQAGQSIQDIEKLLTRPESEMDTRLKGLLDSITTGLEGAESKSAIQLEEEKKRNLESLKTELTNNKATLDKKLAGLKDYDASYQKDFTDIEGKTISLSRMQGAQAQLYRTYQAGRLTYLADISLAEADVSAKTGNYNDAVEAANRATDLRYATQQDKITNQLKAFELIKDYTNDKETKYMEAVKIYLEQQQTALQNKKDLEKLDYAQKLDLISKYHVGSVSDSLDQLNKKVENSDVYKAEVQKEEKHSAIYQEWQDATSAGYKGSFIQYQNEDANRKRSVSNTYNITGTESQGDRTSIISDLNAIKGKDGYFDTSKFRQVRENVANNSPKLLDWFDKTYDPRVVLNPNDPTNPYTKKGALNFDNL